MDSNKIPPNIQSWISALRSGKYNQDRSHLKTTYGYCCMGVACDISGQGQWIKTKTYIPETIVYAYNTGDDQDEELDFLPTVVGKWLGLEGRLGGYNDPDEDKIGSLIDLNDNTEANFNKIADVIEKNWQTMVTPEIREEYKI